jgi:hypothetical protein
MNILIIYNRENSGVDKMKQSKLAGKSLLAVAATIAIAGQAAAAGEWSEIDREIQSCVATVAENASYDDATRVRHAVTHVKERTVGYKLTIETSLYNETGENAIRQYATLCVVNGNNVPMQFSISEAGEGV